jgi:hypothetical protein
MSLAKLDGVDSVVKRRKRLMRQGKAVGAVEVGEGVLQELFDQEYDFQEVCLTLLMCLFDGVAHDLIRSETISV